MTGLERAINSLEAWQQDLENHRRIVIEADRAGKDDDAKMARGYCRGVERLIGILQKQIEAWQRERYFLQDGTEVTAKELQAAYREGRAHIVCKYTAPAAVVFADAGWDTREHTHMDGTPYRVAERSWTLTPDSERDLEMAASGQWS